MNKHESWISDKEDAHNAALNEQFAREIYKRVIERIQELRELAANPDSVYTIEDSLKNRYFSSRRGDLVREGEFDIYGPGPKNFPLATFLDPSDPTKPFEGTLWTPGMRRGSIRIVSYSPNQKFTYVPLDKRDSRSHEDQLPIRYRPLGGSGFTTIDRRTGTMMEEIVGLHKPLLRRSSAAK